MGAAVGPAGPRRRALVGIPSHVGTLRAVGRGRAGPFTRRSGGTLDPAWHRAIGGLDP